MRKLATAAAVSLALASGGAFGLGLGDIEMRSALNQPMDAEIRLTSVQSGELDGMIVQLASPAAFARAGIERSTALTNLRFRVDQSSGSPVIRITSSQPVVEPFLNFLLEIDWPQGRMVREYTVLLDPPVFMTPSATERNTSSDQPAVVQRGEEALIVPTPIERDTGVEVDLAGLTDDVSTPAAEDLTISADEGEIVSLELLPDDALLGGNAPLSSGAGEIVSLTDLSAPNSDALEEREQFLAEQQAKLDSITVELADSVEETSDTAVVGGEPDLSADDSTIVSLSDLTPAVDNSVSNTSSGSASSDKTVTVGQGDTLYEIAKANAGGVSVQQMMMALLTANESAFINKNINLVRAGSILRVPATDEATKLTQAQALAAIGQQNQLWEEYRDTLTGGNTRIASGTRTDEASTNTSDTAAIDTAALDPELSSEDSPDGLSPEARAILDNARNEILDRDELRLVADNAPTSTTASATADETTDNDASRLGEVNLKLQLAREELASTRLQADELSEQASELQGTTDNLDALVSLRQNEIAQLESQLAEARKASEEAAASAAEGVMADASDALDTATDTVEGVVDEAAGSVADAADTAADAAGNVVADGEAAVDAAADQLADAGDAANEVVDSGVNALTEAGEELAEVELLGDEESAAADAATEAEIAPPRLQTTWYQDFISDPKRMMIAGIGGVGLLGVVGTLMFRRRRRDEELLNIDEADFTDDELADLHAQTEGDVDLSSPGVMAGASAGAAGLAAAGVAAVQGRDDNDPAGPTAEELADSSLAFGSETQAIALDSDDAIDQDDTISEVDVYLAYGLHGQAEELLSKATVRDPNNQEYANKLLQTYHAQGNAEGFREASLDFHARFGGESNPEWPAIAAMGAELRPGDELYGAARSTVDRIGSGHSDGAALDDDDFLSTADDDSGSVRRDFGNSSDAVDFNSEDESSLMDQSIDPAFAFDEDDLEATGDFSGIADELAAEEGDGSIEFPGYEAAGAAADNLESQLSDAPELAAGLASGVTDDSMGDLTNELSADLTDGNALLGDALTMDELDRVASVDDLTLDLDQLSGDLELDSSELMNSDLSDLELPDLTSDNELMLDNSGGADNTDEMDTMLDLAKAYIDMGDKDSASSALDEIVKSGNPEQVTEAETLLRKIS